MGRASRGQAALSRTVEKLLEDVELVVTSTVGLIREELRSYGNVPDSELGASIQRNLDRAAGGVRSGTAPAPAEMEEAEIVTHERAREGVPVEDIMRAYRISIGVIQERFVELASEERVPPDIVLVGARLLWSVGDAFTTRVALAYRQISIDSALRDAHQRSDFLRAVLAGALSQAELVNRAAFYGLEADACYSSVRARAEGEVGAEKLRRQLEKAGSGPGRPALVGVLADDCAGIVARRPVLSVPVVVGIGPCVPLLKVAESFRTASLVLDAARKLHACGTFGLEDLSWRLAALAQPDVGRFLAERYLMPLREEGDFGRLLEETMRAYLAQGQSIARAAGVLMVHVNTLRYRLRKFEDLTGTSLASTDVIVELAWALEIGGSGSAEAETPPRALA
jgi:putative transposase